MTAPAPPRARRLPSANVASGGNVTTNAANIGDVNTAVNAAKTHFYSVKSTDTTAGNYNNDGASGANALAGTLAAALDATHGTDDYSAALRDARALMAAPERTPSARVLDSIVQSHQHSFEAFARQQSMAVEQLG